MPRFSARMGSYFWPVPKYLPPNVTQVTVDGSVPNLCGATFPLASSANCTLELNVTGAVNGFDPNPKDHLFVCLGGCVTCCARTNFPLNVTQNNPIYTAIFDAGSSGTRLSFYSVVPGNSSALRSFFKISSGNTGYPIIVKIDTYDDFDDDGINDFLNDAGSINPVGELPPGCPGTSGLGQLDVEPCVIQPLLMKLDEGVAAVNILSAHEFSVFSHPIYGPSWPLKNTYI